MGILGFRRTRSLSVYSKILSNIKVDGTLSQDFVISENSSSNSYSKFLPEEKLDVLGCGGEYTSAELAEAVKKLLDKNTEEGKCDLISFAQKCENIMCYKRQIAELFSETAIEKIGVKILHYTASYLICKSAKVEGVKLGLILHTLAHIDTSPEDREAIKTLALCEEFTALAIEAMHTWENRDEEIFQLAKKTHGWAKAAAVSRLNADTDEVKKWLLEYGTAGSVGVPILAAYVLDKLDFLYALDLEEFASAQAEICGKLIRSALDDREGRAFKIVSYGMELLDKYTNKALEIDCGAELYSVIASIFRYTRSMDDAVASVVHNRCIDILHSERCLNIAEKCLAEGLGMDWITLCGLDCCWKIFELIRTNYSKNIHLVKYISKKAVMQEILQLSRRELGILETENWKPENYTQTEILCYIVDSLSEYIALGEDFVHFALCSSNATCRQSAISVIKYWRSRGYVYLSPSVLA